MKRKEALELIDKLYEELDTLPEQFNLYDFHRMLSDYLNSNTKFNHYCTANYVNGRIIFMNWLVTDHKGYALTFESVNEDMPNLKIVNPDQLEDYLGMHFIPER